MGCCTSTDIKQPIRIAQVQPRQDSLSVIVSQVVQDEQINGLTDMGHDSQLNQIMNVDDQIKAQVEDGLSNKTRQESFSRNSKLHVLSLHVFKQIGLSQNNKEKKLLNKFKVSLGDEKYTLLLKEMGQLEQGLEMNTVGHDDILQVSVSFQLTFNELITVFRNHMNNTLLDLILIFRRTQCYGPAFNNLILEDLSENRQDSLGIRVFSAIVHQYHNEDEIRSTTRVFQEVSQISTFKQLFQSELENQLFFIDKIFDFRSKWELKLLKSILTMIKYQKLLCEKELIDTYICARRNYIFLNLSLPKKKTHLIQHRELYYLEHLRYSIFDELCVRGQYAKLLEYWSLSPTWMFGLQSIQQLEKCLSPKQTSPYQRLLEFASFEQIQVFHGQLLMSQLQPDIVSQSSKVNNENCYHLLLRNKIINSDQLLHLLKLFNQNGLLIVPNKFTQLIPLVTYIGLNEDLNGDILSLLSQLPSSPSCQDDILCFKITNITASKLDPYSTFNKLKFSMSSDKTFNWYFEQAEKVCNQEYLRVYKLLEMMADLHPNKQAYILEHIEYQIDFTQLIYMTFHDDCVRANNIISTILRKKYPSFLMEKITSSMIPYKILDPSEFFDQLLGQFMMSKGWHEIFHHQNRYINNITLMIDGMLDNGCETSEIRQQLKPLLQDTQLSWDMYLRPSFHLTQLCPFGSLYSSLLIIDYEEVNYQLLMELQKPSEESVLWLVLSYIHALTSGCGYERLQLSHLSLSINKIELMEYKPMTMFIFQLLQIGSNSTTLQHYKSLLSDLSANHQSPLNYWIGDEIENWSWSMRTMKRVLELVFRHDTPRFEMLSQHDIEKYYSRYPLFQQELQRGDRYKVFQSYLKSNSVELKYAILRSLILGDLQSDVNELNTLAVKLLQELQQVHGCNICIKLFHVAHIRKIIQYIFLGVVFEMSSKRAIQKYQSGDLYEQLFAQSLTKNYHPYSVLAVDPHFISLRHLLPHKPLQLFDVKPLLDACCYALDFNDVEFVRQCLKMIVNRGEIERFQQCIILQWFFKMFPHFTGRKKLHLTMKIVVRRNPITKKTSLTQEQVEEYSFQDRFFQGQITWSKQLSLSDKKIYDEVLDLYLQQIHYDEDAEFQAMIQLKTQLCHQYQSGELSHDQLQIEQFCRRHCIWYYEPQGNFNLPVMLLILPYLSLERVKDPTIEKIILRTVCIEPLILIQSIQLLSQLQQPEIACHIWSLVFERAGDTWLNELILNCSVQLGSMVHGILVAQQYPLLHSLLKKMIEYKPEPLMKNLTSMIELMVLFTFKRITNYQSTFLSDLLMMEQQHKILNKSKLREVYEILLRNQQYDMLKLLVNRIYYKKKKIMRNFCQGMHRHDQQFYQAMHVHWSICFNEELFQSTLQVNAQYFLQKTNKLKYIMISLCENGLHNKIKMFLGFLAPMQLNQVYLENLLIVQKFGFMQKYMKPNDCWFKYYQQMDKFQEDEEDKVYNFFGSYRQTCYHNRVYQFTPPSVQVQFQEFLPTNQNQSVSEGAIFYATKQVKQQESVDLLDEVMAFSQMSNQKVKFKPQEKANISTIKCQNSAPIFMSTGDSQSLIQIGSQDYLQSELLLFEKFRKMGIHKQQENEEMYIHAIVFHCIFSNDFDLIQILKDFHIDMIKVLSKITSIIIKLINQHKHNKPIYQIIQMQLFPPFLQFYQRNLNPITFIEPLWKLLLQNAIHSNILIDQILFETLVVIEQKSIKAFKVVTLPQIQAILSQLIHHQYWDKRMASMISKFHFGTQKEVYFTQLKPSLEVEPLLPQKLLQSFKEDYLIRLLKCNFFLPLDGVYPYHPLNNHNTNFNVTLTEFLLMRGMIKILGILQTKPPKTINANSTSDLNRYVLASVVGAQNITVTHMAIDLSLSTPNVKQISLQQSNIIQESILMNKSIQSLLMVEDSLQMISIFKKYFCSRVMTVKEFRVLEFYDPDGTYHCIMRCIFTRKLNKFLVYLCYDYMQNKVYKGKKDEFIKSLSKMLTQTNDFMYSKKHLQEQLINPLQMSLHTNTYEVQALIVDCQCQVQWLDPYETKSRSQRFLLYNDQQLEEMISQEPLKQLQTFFHSVRLYKILRSITQKSNINTMDMLERICFYLSYSIHQSRIDQVVIQILQGLTDPVVQAILFTILGQYLDDALQLAQQTELDSHMILCFISQSQQQDSNNTYHQFLEQSTASKQLQTIKQVWRNQEFIETLGFFRKEKIQSQQFWQMRIKACPLDLKQMVEHFCKAGDLGLVDFVLLHQPKMFLDDETMILRDIVLSDMTKFMQIFKYVQNHDKEFVCSMEQLLKILLQHHTQTLIQVFLVSLLNIRKFSQILDPDSKSTQTTHFSKQFKHILNTLGVCGFQQNIIRAQKHYLAITKLNSTTHLPIPQSVNGRVLIPADEPELVDTLVKFIQSRLPSVLPESIDTILRSIVRINRKYCQQNSRDILGERLQLITLGLDFLRKSEALVDQIGLQLSMKFQLAFISSSQSQVVRYDEASSTIMMPTKLVQKDVEDQPQIYFMVQHLDDTLTQIENDAFMAQHLPFITQAMELLNDQIQESGEQFKTHSYQVHLGDMEKQNMAEKKEILKQIISSQMFGLSDMLSDLCKYQSQEVACSKLYHIDDLFAPHNTMSALQSIVRESSSSISSQFSSLSTIKSEYSVTHTQTVQTPVRIISADKKQQSFFIQQLPDSSYQLKQRTPSKLDSTIFPEFYMFSQSTKNLNISFISTQQFKFKTTFTNIFDALLKDLVFYKGYISDLVTRHNSNQNQAQCVNWEVSMQSHGLAYDKEMFQPYRLSKLRSIFHQFQSTLLPIRVNKKQDLLWQFNSLSFMNEIMKPYISTLPTQQGGIFTQIERLLMSWGMFRKVLSTILYHNLVSAKSVMKVITTVYVEFASQNNNSSVFIGAAPPIIIMDEYDSVFQFDKTNYRIFKHTLIVTINLKFVKGMGSLPHAIECKKLIFQENDHLKDYLLKITNQYDFFEQILTNQQIVQFIFNKRDVESMLLKFSQELSEVLSKNISISLNFNQLQAIYRKRLTQIQNQHNSLQRISDYKRIWKSLESLSTYLLDRSRQEIQNQLLRDEVQELFQTILQTLILALREEPYDSTKNQQSVLQQKLLQSYRSFKLNDVYEEKKITQQVGLIEYLGQINEKLIMYSFALQIELNYFLANLKLGEIYIIGWQNSEGQYVACAQIASKNKSNIIGFINLENQSYVQTEVLIEREQRLYSQNNQQLDAAQRFKYQSVEVDELKFVMAVCKTFPEQTMFLNSISNLAIIDGDCNVLLIKDQCLLKHCIMLQKCESEQEKKKIRDFLTINGNFDQLTVSNLVQFIPNCFSIQFEHNRQSTKKTRKDDTEEMIDGKIKIILDDELHFKVGQISLQQTKITCQLEQNQQFTSYLFSFLQWVQQIFQDVKGRKVLVLQKQNRELRDKLTIQNNNIEQASSVFEVSYAAINQRQQTQQELQISDKWIKQSGLFDPFLFVFVYAPELENILNNQSYFVHLISSRIDDILLNLYQAMKEFFLCQDLPSSYKKQLQQYFSGDLICNEMNLLGHYRFKLLRRHISKIELRFFEGEGPASVEVSQDTLQINCYATYPSQIVYFPYANEILGVLIASITEKQIQTIQTGIDFDFCIDNDVRRFILKYAKTKTIQVTIDTNGIGLDDLMQVEFLVASLLIAANDQNIELNIGTHQDHIEFQDVLKIQLNQIILSQRDITKLILQLRNKINNYPDDLAQRITPQDNNELITLKEDSNLLFVYSGEFSSGILYQISLVNMINSHQQVAQSLQLLESSKSLSFSIDKSLFVQKKKNKGCVRFILIVYSETQVLNVRSILIIDNVGHIPHDLDFLCAVPVNECLIGQTWSVLVPVLSLPDLFVQDIPLLQVLSLRKPLHKLTISIISKYVTQNWILLTIYGKKVGKVCIKEYRDKPIIIRSLDCQPTSMVEVEFITNRDISLRNTRIVTKKKLEKDEDVVSVSSKQKNQDNSQVGKFFSALGHDQDNIRLVTIKEQIIIDSIEQLDQIKSFQMFNLIASLSKKEQLICTRAGQSRTEVLLFCDAGGNAVKPSPEYLDQLRYMFVHQTIPHFVYRAHASISSDFMTIELTWKPITKGFYSLIINGEPVKTKTKLVVLAGPVSPQNSTVLLQENNKISFFDKNLAIFSYKDEYFNVFSDIEKSLYGGNNEIQKIELESIKGSTLQCQPKPIDKTGQQQVDFIFETELVDQGNNDTPLMKFYLKDTIIKELTITINGISLEKRKKHFLRELSKVVNTTRSLDFSVKRVNILEDLLKLEHLDLKKSFSIKFQDEEGIDMGGLQREFYDIVGVTMKDQRYKFFQGILLKDEKYHFHNEIVLIREKFKYAKIFGALLANSIANKQIIGLEFSTPFVKVLYGEDITFHDLAEIMDTKGYEFLRQCTDIDLESSCLDFTVTFNKQIHELIPGGSNVQVDLNNLEQYLETLSKFEIKDKFESLFNAFKLGFESVFKIELLAKWIRPYELSIFTVGQKEINHESLQKVIIFKSGNNKLNNFFQQYLQHADSIMLKNFLKFTTGSSSMPFDTTDYKIKVEFNAQMGKNILPVSHTCFKSIEIPHYTSYDFMKKKLDTAFTIGAEGFGFG